MRKYLVEVTKYGQSTVTEFKSKSRALDFANKHEESVGIQMTQYDGPGEFRAIYIRRERRHEDTLIRHKWPEEKPKDDKQYLVRLKFEDGDTMNDTLCYNAKAGRWDGMSSLVTHWWNLPEVTE